MYSFKTKPVSSITNSIVVEIEYEHGDADLDTYETVSFDSDNWEHKLNNFMIAFEEASQKIGEARSLGGQFDIDTDDDDYIDLEDNVCIPLINDSIYGRYDTYYVNMSIKNIFYYDKSGAKFKVEIKLLKDKIKDF